MNLFPVGLFSSSEKEVELLIAAKRVETAAAADPLTQLLIVHGMEFWGGGGTPYLFTSPTTLDDVPPQFFFFFFFLQGENLIGPTHKKKKKKKKKNTYEGSPK